MGALFSWGRSLLKVLREDELKEGRRLLSYCRKFFLGGSTEANMKSSLAVTFLFSIAWVTISSGTRAAPKSGAAQRGGNNSLAELACKC